MKIGFIGLGKMGSQMVARLLAAGQEVVVTDHNPASIEALAGQGAIAAANREELVAGLGETVVIWLMIPAEYVQEEVVALLQLVPKGGIIIDGGNSDFRLTRKRDAMCQAVGVTLLDVGTSGGVMGLQNGFSMMVGGDKPAYETVKPVIQALAQVGGYNHFGPSGAGHYIKMIHNAIEYGAMQAYAEGYRLLKDGHDYTELNLADIGEVWQHGSIIASNLNGLASEILKANPELEDIDGYVAESGEARWTVETAKSQEIQMPSVEAALNVRLASREGKADFGTKLLAGTRNAFGGHDINKS